MNRRQALKYAAVVAIASTGPACLTGLATAATTAPLTQPIMLQATADGRVLQSLDGGRTWTVAANFGSHVTVDSLEVTTDRVYAHLSVNGNPFVLNSTDAHKWYTSGAMPAAPAPAPVPPPPRRR